MIRSPRLFLLPALSLALATCAPVPDFHQAQNLSAKPFDQLDLAGNACGPAALLNSQRFGNPSRSLRPRTDPRHRPRPGHAGIRLASRPRPLNQARHQPQRSPRRRQRDFPPRIPPRPHQRDIGHQPHRKEGQAPCPHPRKARPLPRRRHPPVVSLRLYAKRNGTWNAAHAHFVTIISVPVLIDPGASGFPVRFIDPLGGKFREDRIATGSDPGIDFFAEAEFPTVTIA